MKTIQDYIDYLSSIPEDKWCINVFQNGNGQRCVFGHLIHFQDTAYGYDKKLVKFLSRFENDKTTGSASCIPAVINNGRHPDFQQPTPRQRVLAALRKAQKMEENGL